MQGRNVAVYVQDETSPAMSEVSRGQRTKRSDGERGDGVSDCTPGEDLGFYSDLTTRRI